MTKTAWEASPKKNLGQKPSHFLVEKIVPTLLKLKKASILDVGCYNGRNLRYLAIQTAIEAYGVDVPSTKEHLDEINRYVGLMDLRKIAFITSYSKPLTQILPVETVDSALLWRIVHLLTEEELKEIIFRTVEIVRNNGVIFISARRKTNNVSLYSNKETNWHGVTRGKISEDAPERLYFDSSKSLQEYIRSIAPSSYIWEEGLVPSEFSEFEPVKNTGDEKIEAPCVCAVMRVIKK